MDDIDQLPVEEKEGTIPDEWVTGWWLKQLDRGLPGKEVVDMVRGGADRGGADEDLYG